MASSSRNSARISRLKKSDNFTLDLERAKYWVSKGAQPSDTVASFIKKASKAAAAAQRPSLTPVYASLSRIRR